MPLTLTIRRNDSAAAAPPPLRLDKGGATIGRAPACDWALPDERATISSRHCEIAWQGGVYVITDTSTNGTSINGRRITGPQHLADGDAIGIGPYQIGVTLSADTLAAASDGGAIDPLLRAAGVRRADVGADDDATLEAAGQLLRAFAAGTAMLLDHRSRAREQIGVRPNGAADLGGAGLVLPPLLCLADGVHRITAAFDDLDAHQLATLKAMQGAMKATLDRFSPAAIRAEAGSGADDATLWRAYDRAFGAAQTGFGDLFAAEFRTAYESLTVRAPPR